MGRGPPWRVGPIRNEPTLVWRQHLLPWERGTLQHALGNAGCTGVAKVGGRADSGGEAPQCGKWATDELWYELLRFYSKCQWKKDANESLSYAEIAVIFVARLDRVGFCPERRTAPERFD